MAWNFGDGFDLYALMVDGANGYWDSVTGGGVIAIANGRFSNSRGIQFGANTSMVKTSSVNDAVHHFAFAFIQTTAITGSVSGFYLELFDGATAQCSVVFRTDGAIFITSGGPAGTTLATYTGAFSATQTWYAFEVEVVINNTAGRFRVRKNGNGVDDYDSGAVLDTQNSANTYANKLQMGSPGGGSGAHAIDDFFWRSDASSVAWMGDLRCYTRMPASDSSVQFSRSATTITLVPWTLTSSTSVTANQARYTPFTATYTGTIASVVLAMQGATTANVKCAIYSNTVTTVPGTVLGSATTLSGMPVGNNIFTFGTPVSVTAGTLYWLAFDPDASSGSYWIGGGGAGVFWSSATYASFPTNNPPVSLSGSPLGVTIYITPTSPLNYPFVNEAQQDGAATYVYDSTVNDADLYTIATIPATPASTVAVTTRAYMQKSDAGTRTAAVQIKSGGTTVASPTLTLTTSSFLWAWSTYTTDPNTGSAWAAAAVDSCTVGPKVIS